MKPDVLEMNQKPYCRNRAARSPSLFPVQLNRKEMNLQNHSIIPGNANLHRNAEENWREEMEGETNMMGTKDDSENSVLLFSDEDNETEQLLQDISKKTMKIVAEQVDSPSSTHSSDGDHIPDTIQDKYQQNVLNYRPVCTNPFTPPGDFGRNMVELSDRESTDSDGSLFKTQRPVVPLRQARKRGTGKCPPRSARDQTAENTDSSTDSDDIPYRPNYVMVGHVRKWRQHKKYRNKSVYKRTGRPVGRPRSSITKAEKRRRLKERGLQFPFVQKEYGRKHLPFKMIFAYEQAALCGLFTYMKELKCQKHLIKSLEKINVDCPDRECGPVRQCKYLDEKRPVSPIQESSDETCIEDFDNENTFGVKVVDNSCFVMEKFGKKKKSLREKNSDDKNKDECIPNGEGKAIEKNKSVTGQQNNTESSST
ncbi:TATA box-binding protein-associated factor RNA polymerase I subunit D-like isoform X3 [Stegostoma tigrinum]|uniref:TATA box-binding protein-associated factor RNA polymerase I subunit D-like isoform X3 n=1 Tax=Stegostoma tigrinum TaxID=3053191 RepID=UPI00202B8845|nr:TATA box-binding protein-associated factor RNA polymerase I subunit D-like isoform X3 [Stegostoma tigrinum]